MAEEAYANTPAQQAVPKEGNGPEGNHEPQGNRIITSDEIGQGEAKVEKAKEPNNEATQDESRLVYSTRPGIRRYALERAQTTDELLLGASIDVADLLDRKYESEGRPVPEHAEILKDVPRAVAEVIKGYMSSGLSIPRVLLGGNYKLEDVLDAVSCIDASVFARELCREFGLDGRIETTNLLAVPNHHFFALDSGEVIDPIMSAKRNPGGYYPTREAFEKRLAAVNSLGFKAMVSQTRRLLTGAINQSGAPQKSKHPTDATSAAA